MINVFKRKRSKLHVDVRIQDTEAFKDLLEQFKETIGNLNQELLTYREQNDRLQKRCEELEKTIAHWNE